MDEATEDDQYADLISTTLPSSATSSPLLTSSSSALTANPGVSASAADNDLLKANGRHSFGLNGNTATTTTEADCLEADGDFADTDFAMNDMFEFDEGCGGLLCDDGGGDGDGMHNNHRVSPHLLSCAMQTHLMSCDNDPLISGNDIINPNLGSLKNGSGQQSNTAFMRVNNTSIPVSANSGTLSGGSQSHSLPTCMMAANDYATRMTNNGAFFESSSSADLRTEGEETEEDDKTIIGWLADTAVGNHPQNNRHLLLHRQSSMVDLSNGHQQNSLISSTSSPTVKQQQAFWSAYNGLEAQQGVHNGDCTVSSSLEMDLGSMDDASLEIETILQQGANVGVNGVIGRQLASTSPPKLSSSLPAVSSSSSFKSPNLQQLKSVHQQQQQQHFLKQPSFVQLNQTNQQAPLLTGLLQASTSANVNELLRSANGPVLLTANVNGGGLVSSNGLNFLPTTSGQQYAIKGANRGKTMYNGNCPTLANLIGQSNSSNSSSLPPIGAMLRHNGNPNLATILSNAANNANNANRNRNNSMSTDYSVSSHDEGFGSQPDEDDQELEGLTGLNGSALSDQCSDDGDICSIEEMMMMVGGDCDGIIGLGGGVVSGAPGTSGDLMEDGAGEECTSSPYFLLNQSSATMSATVNIGGNNGGLNGGLNSCPTSASSVSSDSSTLVGREQSQLANNANNLIIKQEHMDEPMWCPTTSVASNGHGQQQAIKTDQHLLQQQAAYHHQTQMMKQCSQGMDDDEEEERTGNGRAGTVGSDGEEDDVEDDDDDESFYGDYQLSDLIGASTSDDINNKWSLNMGRSRKGTEKRFFWQYNVQSKGPKGPRYATGASGNSHHSNGSGGYTDEEEDPHVFNEIADPVFAPDCQVEGVKHSGKARRGDGNDLTPNPKKLLMIGLELKKLSRVINDLTPVTEVPAPARNKSRKEKNKLASRACRLKKKAQHEANKIKLHGLHREHGKMLKQISALRKIVEGGVKMVRGGLKNSPSSPLCVSIEGQSYQVRGPSTLESLVEQVCTRHRTVQEVSGRTADYVNGVLDNVTEGVITGGIDNV